MYGKVTAIPSTKEEKTHSAKFASRPYKADVVEIDSMDDLIEQITKYAWSPSTFREFRSIKNFISCDFMVLDIDDGMTIDEAEKIADNLKCLCLIMSTSSHTKEHHRFRVIFPLSKTIDNIESFSATWEMLQEHFTSLDANCKDCSRFYFACTKDDYVVIEDDDYKLLEPIEVHERDLKKLKAGNQRVVNVEKYENTDLLKVIYPEKEEIDKIPESLHFFLKFGPNAGITNKGERKWWRLLNDFVFTLSLMDTGYDEIINLVATIAPEDLTDFDLNTIERAYNDGQTYKD